jgi:hypothetical protein
MRRDVIVEKHGSYTYKGEVFCPLLCRRDEMEKKERKNRVVYLQGRGFWGYEAGRHVKHRDSGRDVADYLVVVLARVVRGEGVEAVCLESVWVVAAASVLDDWLAFTRNLKLTPYHSDALPLVAL